MARGRPYKGGGTASPPSGSAQIDRLADVDAVGVGDLRVEPDQTGHGQAITRGDGREGLPVGISAEIFENIEGFMQNFDHNSTILNSILLMLSF